tara:strand:+ start:1081 stop:2505 length:1425 start_codon:yes stop_codon:yes gene_type:complete
MISNLLDVVISNGLGLPVPQINNLKEIPRKSFGVFVTIKRSIQHKDYPKDIHGCIGDWENDFKVMSKLKLLETMKNVSKNATDNDKRREYFKPLRLDSKSRYEITFMMKPIYSINTKGVLSNRKKFNNIDYGLIVEGENGQRATYLPNVFPNESWDMIKNSLIKKSGSTEGNKFYAYKTITYEKHIFEVFNKGFFREYIESFLLFIKGNYKDRIPYEKDTIIKYDESQNVRNIASIYDIIRISNNSYNGLKKKILNELRYYKNKMEKDYRTMRQASPFLILSFYELKVENIFIKKVCNYLYSQINDLEKKFELGEVLIALCRVCPKKGVLFNEQRKMYRLLKDEYTINDIFEYNWQAKYLHSLYKNKLTKNTKNTVFNHHVEELANRIIIILNNYNEGDIETNYLAVTFEALSGLRRLILTKELKIKVEDNILSIFILLNKRYKNGLFYWNSMKSARIDITGHVMNGIMYLINL